jgi:hypothetical protein
MRSKFVKLLTVYLVALAIIFPALVVFDVVWQRHLELKKIQLLACESNHYSLNTAADFSSKSNFYSMGTCVSSIREKETILHQKNKIFDVFFSDKQDEKFIYFVEWFLFMPVVLGFGVFLYNKYLLYQAAVFQKQVEMLERLWQQNIEP